MPQATRDAFIQRSNTVSAATGVSIINSLKIGESGYFSLRSVCSRSSCRPRAANRALRCRSAKPLFAHQFQVDSASKGHQSLVCADVGCCLLSADVLLSGRQCNNESSSAIHVFCLSNESTGKASHMLLRSSNESQPGAAIGKWNAK